MSTLSTVKDIVAKSKCGVGVRCKIIVFLLNGLGKIGLYRKLLRKIFIFSIGVFKDGQFIEFSKRLKEKEFVISLRYGNEGDYLMAGELISDGYTQPSDFVPKQIIDAGSNIGMFAIEAYALFPGAELVCYEPDRGNYQMLTKNIISNNIKADVRNKGCWSKDTNIYFHSSESQLGYVDEHPPGVEIPCELPVVTSDCWLKMDIEGGEYEVLPALLDANTLPRWISLEIHYYKKKGRELIDLLEKKGYQVSGDMREDVDCKVINLALK